MSAVDEMSSTSVVSTSGIAVLPAIKRSRMPPCFANEASFEKRRKFLAETNPLLIKEECELRTAASESCKLLRQAHMENEELSKLVLAAQTHQHTLESELNGYRTKGDDGLMNVALSWTSMPSQHFPHEVGATNSNGMDDDDVQRWSVCKANQIVLTAQLHNDKGDPIAPNAIDPKGVLMKLSLISANSDEPVTVQQTREQASLFKFVEGNDIFYMIRDTFRLRFQLNVISRHMTETMMRFKIAPVTEGPYSKRLTIVSPPFTCMAKKDCQRVKASQKGPSASNASVDAADE